MENQQNQNYAGPEPDQSDSLEARPATIVEQPASQPSSSSAPSTPEQPSIENTPLSELSSEQLHQPVLAPLEHSAPKPNKVKQFFSRFNIYLLLFLLALLLGSVVVGASYLQSKKTEKAGLKGVVTEPLSEKSLEQLKNADVTVGDPKQILSVESNAVFAGQVLLRGNLEVAGQIKAGGPLNLNGLTVGGNSTFGDVQASQLQISGNATVQGQLAVQSGLTVSGSGSFGGTLTAARLNIQQLQVSGDIQFTRHIDAGGGTPNLSYGSALGGGGTSSISGTDTAGTVVINTGGGTSAGCFASINFIQRFASPHIVITPIGPTGAALNYYVNRTSTSFSICTTNAAPAGSSFAFDYTVID